MAIVVEIDYVDIQGKNQTATVTARVDREQIQWQIIGALASQTSPEFLWRDNASGELIFQSPETWQIRVVEQGVLRHRFEATREGWRCFDLGRSGSYIVRGAPFELE